MLTSAPKKPKNRSISIIRPLDAEGKNGLISIRNEKLVLEYFLDRIPSGYGEAFLLEKRVYDGADNRYHVYLEEGYGRCDCKGFENWGRCKHLGGLLALKARGRL